MFVAASPTRPDSPNVFVFADSGMFDFPEQSFSRCCVEIETIHCSLRNVLLKKLFLRRFYAFVVRLEVVSMGRVSASGIRNVMAVVRVN